MWSVDVKKCQNEYWKNIKIRYDQSYVWRLEKVKGNWVSIERIFLIESEFNLRNVSTKIIVLETNTCFLLGKKKKHCDIFLTFFLRFTKYLSCKQETFLFPYNETMLSIILVCFRILGDSLHISVFVLFLYIVSFHLRIK